MALGESLVKQELVVGPVPHLHRVPGLPAALIKALQGQFWHSHHCKPLQQDNSQAPNRRHSGRHVFMAYCPWQEPFLLLTSGQGGGRLVWQYEVAGDLAMIGQKQLTVRMEAMACSCIVSDRLPLMRVAT